MKRVKYIGPFGALEIDGLRLEAGGDAVELTDEQIERARAIPRAQLRVLPPLKSKQSKAKHSTGSGSAGGE